MISRLKDVKGVGGVHEVIEQCPRGILQWTGRYHLKQVLKLLRLSDQVISSFL